MGRRLGEGVQAPGLLGPTWGCDLETSWCEGAWVAVLCWAGRAAEWPGKRTEAAPTGTALSDVPGRPQ